MSCDANNLWPWELEKTLFERMCMTQRLKGCISSCRLMGNSLEPFFDGFGGYLNPTVKGTLFENLTSVDMQQEVFQGEECRLEKDVLNCLEEFLVRTGKSQKTRISGHVQGTTTNAKARQYNKFSYRGAIFSPSSFSVRDSHVVIGRGAGTRIPRDWYAGKIKQIFMYPFSSPSGVYFVIQKFRELSSQEALQDPYRQFPLVGGRLYHPELEDEIEVVPSQEIIAHFAHTPHGKQDFGFPCFHALPLDKVTLSSRHTLSTADVF
jgi:hypothetical protein